MERTYILTPLKHKHISITFKFDSKGLLNEFKIGGEVTEAQHDFLIKSLPLNLSGIGLFSKDIFRIEEVPIDVSFEAFWEAYDYKVGKKKMCESKWNTMTEDEKIKAILYIPRYNVHLLKTQIQKAYPHTYLNQNYYDN